MKFGSLDITDCKLGDTPIVEVRRGTELIWPDNAIPQDSLIAEWKLEETSGTTVYDSAGTNNLTHASDLSLLSTTDAKVGTALNFDGQTSANGANINIAENGVNTAFSLSFWYKQVTVNSLVFFMGNGSTPSWDVYVSGNYVKFRIYKSDGSTYITESGSLANEWTHISVVVDPATSPYVSVYLNGVNTTVTTTGTYGDARDGVGDFALGGRADYNNKSCYGIMDEVKIWRKVLTPEEITNIYNAEV